MPHSPPAPLGAEPRAPGGPSRSTTPTTSGVLQAEAREVAVSPRLSTCEVRVTDETRDLVALFTGTAYRKKERLADVEAL